MLKWQDQYTTGYPRIDQDHRELFALCANLWQDQGRRETDAVIREITASITDHFQREEDLMEELGYPELEVHRQVHAVLRQGYAEAVADASMELESRLLDFVQERLIPHIKNEDARLAGFCRGPRP